MRKYHTLPMARLLAAFALAICPAVAAGQNNAPPQVELTASGNLLLTKYTGLLEFLRKDISKDLPDIDDQKIAAYSKIREAEIAAEATVKDAQTALAKVGEASALIRRQAFSQKLAQSTC